MITQVKVLGVIIFALRNVTKLSLHSKGIFVSDVRNYWFGIGASLVVLVKHMNMAIHMSQRRIFAIAVQDCIKLRTTTAILGRAET